MTGDLRIGVVGTGFGARVVAPVFAATSGCTVVEVISPRDPDAIAALCGRTDVDLISVHAPPFLHPAVVLPALAAGHAVLCDKPFGVTRADAERMTTAAAAAGVPALVNFEFRWAAGRLRVGDLLRSGVLGAVERVVWTHWSAGSRVPLRPYGWLFDRRAGGGWLGAWGSHAVDALRGWFGELEVVTAELTTTITSRPDRDGRPQACDADDGMSVTLRTAAGVLIVIDSTFAAPATLAPRLVIVGSAAIVEVVADRRVVLHRADGTRDEWTAAADGDAHLAPMRAWATVVRDTVRGEAHPEGAATFADGLAVRTLLDRIVEAAGR